MKKVKQIMMNIKIRQIMEFLILTIINSLLTNFWKYSEEIYSNCNEKDKSKSNSQIDNEDFSNV